jgi:transposase
MKISTMGIDLAKSVFAIHGVDDRGGIVIRNKLRRGQMVRFFSKLEPCLIGMEASAGAHYWARELSKLGHEVKLMPASYVKAYVKRGKTDAADAAAICEAVTRPTMRFVPIKSEAQQSLLALHRVRELLVRQRTQAANTMRALCAEFGVVAAKGRGGLSELQAMIVSEEENQIPIEARIALRAVIARRLDLHGEILRLEKEILRRHRANETSRRLATVPGIGPISATAIVASVGDVSRFASGRHFAAWIGLTPKSHSSGGKERLGPISKQGDRYLRQLLVQGAQAVRIAAMRSRQPSWVIRLSEKRGAKIAAVAQANKTARIAWALMTRGETYRKPNQALKAA